MRAVENTSYTVTYPNDIFETRGRFAYIKVKMASAEENVDVTLQFGGASGLVLSRKTDASGVAVFPVGRIFEATGKIAPTVVANDRIQSLPILYPIVGYAAAEIQGAFDDNTFYPASPCIVAYPNLGQTQPLFLPYFRDFSVISQSGIELGYTNNGPVAEFDASKIPQQDQGKNIGVGTNPDQIDIEIKTYYDYCTNGVFLKWIDGAGVPYLYRWTQEVEIDEVSVDSTYKQLDETLNPYESSNKTMTNRYTLHSRIVERDVFNMCRTILGCQELFMYDPDLSDWVRCSIEDGESEDTGAPMQDVQIEVVKYEYL